MLSIKAHKFFFLVPQDFRPAQKMHGETLTVQKMKIFFSVRIFPCKFQLQFWKFVQIGNRNAFIELENCARNNYTLRKHTAHNKIF